MGGRDPEAYRSGGDATALAAFALVAEKLGVHIGLDTLRSRHGGEPASPRRLIRIADENGFRARRTRLTFDHLVTLGNAYPAILRLRSGACVVAEGVFRTETSVGIMVRDPLEPGAPALAIDRLRLQREWDGEAILVKRRAEGDEATRPFGFLWMLGMVLKERTLFRDIGIAAIALSLLALVPPLLYMVIIDRILVHHRMSTLGTLVGAIAVLLAFETTLGYLRRSMVATATARVDARVSTIIFDRMVALPIDFFDRTPTGIVAYKLGEVRRVRNFLTGQLFSTLLDATTLIVLIPAMFMLNASLTWFVLTIAVLMGVVVLVYMRPMADSYSKVIAAEQRKNQFMIEALQGVRTVKSLALEGRKRREWDSRVADSVRASTDMQHLANQPQTLLAPLEKLIYAGSLCLGGYLAISGDHTVFAGTLVAFTMIAGRATAPIVQIAGLLQQVQEVKGAIAQVASVVNTAPEPRRANGVRPAMRGPITFSDVRFYYPEAKAPALDGISFSVEPGTVVGVMGRSGSGKTTLTRLLQGLHQSYEGLIKIDGVELREIDLDHLRARMGVVLQDSFLFQGTIRENILVGCPEAGVEKMIEAARLAGAEEFIERLPRSYDTVIEENASNLSGGQRQRIAIARALVMDPPLLVFDEATSALDPDSEAVINENLRRMAKGRTVIVISHRLASLTDCDQILCLERGRLLDAGRHLDLLDRCEVYSHLWYQQNRHLSPGGKHGDRIGAATRS
ncbi:peptidase domain-containing ABC transporter [Chthonobacter rhizosphaerae]|uniref:peptidase domain-containing ABC transporter n=1 Tax=Chthonobacter rhizosphaerae TaxID=2735553 RepID=UPI0015EEF2E2|nr:peptidase domain-containing ABC transporter [Chthonobacter rhizosphaerae]